MRNTPNYNLPQYEGTDKFTKEVLNDGFSKIDLAISDLQETFNVNGSTSTLTTQEVINARNGKQNLKERIDEIDEQYNDIANNKLPQITEQLETKVNYVSNINSLKNSDITKGVFIKTLGYYNENDGGGALYSIIDGEFIEDGALYHKLKNGLFAKLIIEDEINIKKIGAIGDGNFDNTDIIDKAIELAKDKYKVHIPNGIFYIAEPLTVPTHYFTLYGDTPIPTDPNLYKQNGECPIYYSTIKTKSTLFGDKTSTKNIGFEIYGINFSGNRTSALFERLNFDGCKFHDNNAYWYNCFIDGVIRYVSRISNNRFYYLEDSFLQDTYNISNANVIDSIIEKNEIMGVPGSPNYCFITNEFAMSLIKDNYIEFFSFNFKTKSGSGNILGVNSTGNIYDYFLQMTTDNCGFASGLFSGDIFSNVSKESAEKWNQPTNLYNPTDMTVFRFKNGDLNKGIRIENGSVINISNFAKFDSWGTTKQCLITINNIRIHNSGIHYGGFPMTFNSQGESGYYNFIINNNIPTKVSSLPSNGYNGQMIISDRLYYYWNGAWR